MRLTKQMLEMMNLALVRFEVLAESDEKELELAAKCRDWIEDELDRREARKKHT